MNQALAEQRTNEAQDAIKALQNNNKRAHSALIDKIREAVKACQTSPSNDTVTHLAAITRQATRAISNSKTANTNGKVEQVRAKAIKNLEALNEAYRLEPQKNR